MNNDYDKIEENLKKKTEPKKEVKKSGRSVFKLQEIMRQKAVSSQIEKKKKSEQDRDENQQNNHRDT